eukprot:m.78332 g.78332  ORF g.78332 m.78332 type:complete len:221 (+) comp12666_c0_seq3:179-841(+)
MLTTRELIAKLWCHASLFCSNLIATSLENLSGFLKIFRPPSFTRGSHSGKTLVLDLDETLIHSQRNPDPFRQYDLQLQVDINGELCNFYVSIRPNAGYFIETVAQWYDIVIFTAGIEHYASPIIAKLNDRNYIKRSFFRESCSFVSGVYMKDLRKVEQDLSSVIIIDNSATGYELQPNNGVPIKSWFDDPFDEELLDLIPFLDALRHTHDVRSVLSLRQR